MKYSIIVPVYNQLEYTKECIQSVIDMSNEYDYELIIVANGCGDGTEDWILKKREWSDRAKSLVLCSYREPLGFGGAMNVGMKISRGRYFILLNNDCKILHSMWIALLEEPFQNPQVGITGPLKYWSDITKRDALVFFCVMIRKEVVEKIGFLDAETFPIGAGEDTDFCARAIDAGFLIEQVPKASIKQEAKFYTGQFPIYHVGEVTLKSAYPDWDGKLYLEHREALKRKYEH